MERTTPTPEPRPRWRPWMTYAAAALLLVATALYLVSPTGDCSSDRGCPSGQRCVPYETGQATGWQRLMRMRACVTPCATDADCTAGRRCLQVSHGPQGPHCRGSVEELY